MISIRAAVLATAALPLGLASEAEAQDFKIPVSISHLVYQPGTRIVEPQMGTWTVGLGMIYGLNNHNAHGLVAQATYGGTYWYWAGGAGLWNGGFEGAENELGLGVGFHYNVFQSQDLRTRVGPHFAWGTADPGDARTHALTYRAMVSRTLSPSRSLYGGLGAETVWHSTGGSSTRSTHVSLSAGMYARLGERLALSSGIETLSTDPPQFSFSSSLHFSPGRAVPGNPRR